MVVVDRAAKRYVLWLYRCASARPDLTLLARVAGAVAVLEDRPEDLAARLHDELAITMAAVPEKRPELALAIARLRPRSPVLINALGHSGMRPAACAALANHLDDEGVLTRYLALLRDLDRAVVRDALAGLEAFRGLPRPVRRGPGPSPATCRTACCRAQSTCSVIPTRP